MANIFLNIPVVPGVGPLVDISGMGAEKTIVVSGPLSGAVTLEISTDGGSTWCPLTTFTSTGKRVITFAAFAIRANSSSGIGSVNIGANDDGTLFVNIPAPPLNGVGAAVDISALGNLTTVVVQGGFGGGVIGIQISEDGVNFAEFVTFPNPGCITKSMVGDFVRAVSRGATTAGWPYAPAASMAAISSDGAANPAISAPRSCFVFGPGPSRENRYSNWDDLMAAMSTVEGCKTLMFDDEGTGFQIPIPVGNWEMRDVTWVGAAPDVIVIVDEGTTFNNLRKITDLIVFWTGATPPVADFNLVPMIGARFEMVELYQVDLLAMGATGPFFLVSDQGIPSKTVTFNMRSASLSSGVPLIDVDGTFNSSIAFSFETCCSIPENSISGDPGTSLSITSPSPGNLISLNQPQFLGAVLDIDNSLQATQWSIQPLTRFGPFPAVTDWVGQVNKFDTTFFGPFTQVLSPAAFTTPGATLCVKKVAGAGALTIDPFPGDTIDGSAAGPVIVSPTGSLTLIRDLQATSNWLILSSNL